MEDKALKYDENKLRWDLLPLPEIEDIVRVYTSGASKYGENTWQGLEDGYNRYKAAMFRHLVEYEKGNTKDEETGCLHLAQVAWNAIAMLHISKGSSEPSLLDKLNKRIEEKICETNKILDTFSNISMLNRDIRHLPITITISDLNYSVDTPELGYKDNGKQELYIRFKEWELSTSTIDGVYSALYRMTNEIRSLLSRDGTDYFDTIKEEDEIRKTLEEKLDSLVRQSVQTISNINELEEEVEPIKDKEDE